MNEHARTASTAALVALHLAGKGLPVFPCDPATKRPLTERGFKDASTDLPTVTAFWHRYPAALVGMPTGKRSGVFALDLDINKDSGEALGETWLLGAGFADLLKGPGATTPSAGKHIYFRADGFAEGLGKTVGKIAKNVDTRGEGGYIIAPDSVGAAAAYVARNGGLDAVSLPALPEALLAALTGNIGGTPFAIDTGRAPYTDARADLAEAQEIVRHIPPDCGYGEWLAVLMGLHAQFGGSGSALNLADQWSAIGSKYKPGEVAEKWRGFPPGEGGSWQNADEVWGSVCKLARNYGADLSDIARRHKGNATTPAKAAPRKPEAEVWLAPEARYLRPELPQPPNLPMVEVFGPIWARWIAGASESKSAPPDYIAAALLSVSGALIGNTRWVSPWAGWSEL